MTYDYELNNFLEIFAKCYSEDIGLKHYET